MSKRITLENNNKQNFVLRGFNSIQIGLYFITFTFLFKSLFDGFLSDVSLLGMMSVEIVEFSAIAFILLLILLSGLAVLFSSRRITKRSGYKLMNKKSFRQFAFYLGWTLPSFLILYTTAYSGHSMYVGVAFLFLLGTILIVLNSNKKRPLYLLAVTSLSLGMISYLIPTYWYSSLMIMGGAFFVYGIMIKK